MRAFGRCAAVVSFAAALVGAIGVARGQEPVPSHEDYFAEFAEPTEEALVSHAESLEVAACPAPGECDCPACQAKKKAELQKAVAGAYKPLFYDNNFAYINSPLYDQWFPGDRFKQMHFGDCWTVDLGGQFRLRYMDETNHRGLGMTGLDDDFMLYRTRVFANAKYSDWLRAYAEYIDAESNNELFAPRAIEVNRSDMLNLFGDVRLNDGCCGELWFRGGRQELLYGSERLISPLDWANTRRTFDGGKFFWKGENWNVDVFYTQPVRVNPTHFDHPDHLQDFFGAWGTYKAIPNETIDLYAIQYNNDRGLNDFEFTTLGGRWLGSKPDGWLWEAEGGVQFGQNTDGSGHGAGFVTGGLGRKWDDHCWKPQLWCYYDWASGGNVLGAGNGFNHLFPLGHKYLGYMDLFGRSNIQSPNVQFTCQPHERVKFLAWYYYLSLATTGDTPYTVVMTPYNPGNAPASADLGQELDLLVQCTINARMEIWFGYSHFWAGEYFQLTPGAFPGDGDFFYTQFHWNF
jgi:hypothetical protein